MTHKKIFLFFLIGAAVFASCKKEKAEYATFRYTVSVGGEKKVVDYASEENRCTFIGYEVNSAGDTLSFFRQINGCFVPISIETTESYSSTNEKKCTLKGIWIMVCKCLLKAEKIIRFPILFGVK